MASLPSQASRRRSSPTAEASSEPQQSSAVSSSYDTPESDYILLNEPKSAGSSSHQTTPGAFPQDAASPTLIVPPQPTPQAPERESRRCWVCQMDDTDDTPESGEWRTPCPCSLTAHDRCLLEWISNEEAPPQGGIAHNHVIKCPQCKAEYKIERPRDYLVAVVDKVQKLAWGLVVPTGLSAVMGCAYSGLFIYGHNAMQMVFGVEETRRYLATSMGSRLFRVHPIVHTMGRIMRTLDPFFPSEMQGSVQLMLGLPLIAPCLVLLRTKAADQGLALLLPLYFLKESNRNVTHWPPSPGLAFATIPYFRTAYNELYRYAFADLEKKWDEAVQRVPREGETPEQIAAANQGEEGRAIFEIEIIHEEEDEPPAPIRPPHRRGARRGQPNQPVQAGGNNAAAAQGQNGQANPAPAQRDPLGWEVRQNISAGALISSVMGALFFPAISSIMGDILKYTLPARFVEHAVHHRGRFGGISMKVAGRGLLKEKWGRSLVGGCLFVVLKDVITLYCKWKKARDFGKRKVMDYVGKRNSASTST